MATTTTARPTPPEATAPLVASAENPHHERRWLILAVLCVAQLMVILDGTIVNIALPSAQRTLGFSDDNRQWIVTSYALAFGSLVLLGGRLSDMFGRKWTFIGGLLGFGLASAIGGVAQSFEVLVGARVGQGIFAAMLAPAALSLLTITFSDGKERSKAFGIYGAIAGAGGAIGLLLGGALTDYLSWRWCLYVNLALAIPAAIAGLVLLVNQREAVRPRLDVPGTVVITAGLFAIVYGVSHAETTSWTNTTTEAFIAAGVLLVAAFVFIESRGRHPLLPLHILRDRDRFASYAAVGIITMGFFGLFLFLTYYMQRNLGYSPVKTGLAFMPLSVGIIAASIASEQVIMPRVGRKIMVSAGLAIAAGGMVLLTRIGLQSTYRKDLAPALSIIGVGSGLVFAPAFSGGTLGVTDEEAGVASATVNTFQQVGGSFGTALLSTLLASAVTNGIEDRGPGRAAAQLATIDGYTTAFWWASGILAVGAVFTGLLYRPHTRVAGTGAPPVDAH